MSEPQTAPQPQPPSEVETLKARITELEQENQSLKERIAELEDENQKLREALEKGAQALEEEIEEAKAAAIEAITQKTRFTKDELRKMRLPALRLILRTIDSAKGTFKNIRSAGSSTGDKDSGSLTVGDLYHKKEEQ
jgi:predicted RNase H-like nuclease (RuvC/YqgF family)